MLAGPFGQREIKFMPNKNVFLSTYFANSLTDRTYEAIFLLVRILSSLHLGKKILLNSISSRNFRNFEIIELNSNLISTYVEACKAFDSKVADELFELLGKPLDEKAKNIRNIFKQKKSEAPIDYQIFSFLRDDVTFHFHSEYISRIRINENERIHYMGFVDPNDSEKVILTNTVPHILEVIQKLTGSEYDETSVLTFFRDTNQNVIFPFIEYLQNLSLEVFNGVLVEE